MKKDKSKGLQNFSKALIVPILFLPIVGILMALSAILSNTSFVPEGSAIFMIGKFIYGTISTIITNLSILFCVGLAFGLAKKKKAEAALVALMSYLIFLSANSTFLALSGKVIKGNTAADLYGTGQTIYLGFHITDMGVFIGIVLGILIAWIHNKYCDKEFDGAFAILGNTKFVFLVSCVWVCGISILAAYVWPFIASGISALSNFMSVSGPIGVFIYGFLNRVLIPTGLHHLVWTPFLYSSIGGQAVIAGKSVAGALPIFLGELSGTSGALDPSCKYLMFGMVKMFGLMGGTFAIIKCAHKNKREEVKGALVPGALTAFLVGITEPVEFTFVFAAPLLWVVYSALDGLFQMFAYLLNCHVCAYTGILDFCVYNLPLGVAKTNWPVFVILGIIEAVVCYFVFTFMIKKFNLKTLGRKDDQPVAAAETSVGTEVAVVKKSGTKNDAEKAEKIITGLGGKDNILTLESCFTRLRVALKDSTQVNDDMLRSTGASGVVHSGNSVQVVYGVSVNKIRTIVDDALGNTEE
jgi:PTS system arbutin-like IIC component